jgi:CDP-4-dehydro-6-deoxyglucose reductase/ferredoxin-NAD(P)+ reductase (naphthalene dioxygenase ferredoxin-specific)
MEGYDPGVLSTEERAAGFILACRSRARGDVEVAWLEEDSPEQSSAREATIERIEPATHDITRIRLALPGSALVFRAGQYARLRFPHCPARPYSMANLPSDRTLEFHVRRVPGGVVSNYVAESGRVGDPVLLKGPYGTAFLREPLVTPMLLIAGGSGLAPMKSILLAALAQKAERPIYLYHGVRDERDLYDGHAVIAAGMGHPLIYIPVLSSPSDFTQYRAGLVHEAVAADFANLAGFYVYLAGPPPMVDAATATAIRLGARPECIHADPFYFDVAAGKPKQPDAAPPQVPWWKALQSRLPRGMAK